MIQPLRTCHRWTFAVLAIIVPVVFAAGLAARRKPPLSRGTIEILISASGPGQRFKHSIVVWSEFPKVRLIANKPFVVPDALVYWSNQAPEQNRLAPDAVYLGPLDPVVTYQIPVSLPGYLVIYSPAQQAILDYAAFGERP